MGNTEQMKELTRAMNECFLYDLGDTVFHKSDLELRWIVVERQAIQDDCSVSLCYVLSSLSDGESLTTIRVIECEIEGIYDQVEKE